MKYVAIFLLKVYRSTVSRIKGKRCIYSPSCSVFAMEAYLHFGFFKGTALTAKRVFRCAPWGKGGFDPVPLNKKGDAKWFL